MKRILCLDMDPVDDDELLGFFDEIYEKRYTFTRRETAESFLAEYKKTPSRYSLLIINFEYTSFLRYRFVNFERYITSLKALHTDITIVGITSMPTQAKNLQRCMVPVLFKTLGLKQLVKQLRPGMGMKTTNYKKVIMTVCKYYSVTYGAVMGKSRKREVVKVRQIAMFFVKEFTTFSLKKIGSKFKKDHTSVLSNKNVVLEEQDCNTVYAAEITELRKLIEVAIAKTPR